MNPIKIEKQKLLTIGMSYRELVNNYKLTKKENFKDYIFQNIVDDVINPNLNDFIEHFNRHFDEIVEDQRFIIEDIFNNSPEDMMYYPINLYRLILNSQNIFNIKKSDMTDLEPMYVLQKINRMILPK